MRAIAIAGAVLLLAGCSAVDTADYYWQGATGQLEILARAKPIPEAIAESPDVSLKQRLARVQEIRAYASRELGLPDNGSYTRYTDLGRQFVVWNVFAAPELSLSPMQWCFPIAGCVNYRGYFNEKDARDEAARLTAAGDDVWVSGVPAYSTLGYFDDPILSTFVRWPETEVARMVFHELAHQVVYVKDDTQFNESFAVTVEEAGVRRWLAAQGRPDLDAQFARAERLRATFRDLGGKARRQGEDLRRNARGLRPRQGGPTRPRRLRPLVRGSRRQGAEQREHRLCGALYGAGAGIQGAAGRRGWRPAALLRPGEEPRPPVQGGAGHDTRPGRPPSGPGGAHQQPWPLAANPCYN